MPVFGVFLAQRATEKLDDDVRLRRRGDDEDEDEDDFVAAQRAAVM